MNPPPGRTVAGPGIWVEHIQIQELTDEEEDTAVGYGVLKLDVTGAFLRLDGQRRPFRLNTHVPMGDALAADLHGGSALLDLFRTYTLGQRIAYGHTEFVEHEIAPFRLDEIIAEVEAREQGLAKEALEPESPRRRPSIVDAAMYGAGMVRDARGVWVPRKKLG